jgi:hypothetical protein
MIALALIEQASKVRQKIQAPAMGLLFFENAYTIS